MKLKKKLMCFFAAMCLTVSSFGSLTVMADDDTTTTEATDTSKTDESTTAPDCTGKYVNIAFVVDTTGSMSGDISTVKENLTAFVKEIAASGAIPRIAIIDYKDIEEDGEDTTVVHETPDYSVWFDDTDKVIAEIETLKVDGGGDYPESLVDALGYVVSDDVMTFNKFAAKFAFVLTDADYKVGNRWGYESLDQVADKLSAKGIQTTVVTHPDNYAEDEETLSDRYTGLVEKTGGKLIDLSSDFATELSTYAKDIISKTAEVKVDEDYIPVTSITLGEDVSVVTDGTYKFPVTVTPDNATVKDIIWKVEDESIATINTDLTTSELCVINPVKEGETKLIAKTADGGYTAYFTLTVKDIVADGESAVTCKPDMVAGIISDEAVTKVTLKCDKETPTVDADVLKTIFEALAAAPTKDITFSFEDELGDEVYSWNFASKELKDATTAIKSFAIDPEAKVDVVTAAVEATKTDGKTETIHFAHDGELPGTATVTTETKLPDGTAYLYYFNPETKKLELVSDSVKVADGKATYKIEHCCDYVLSLKKLDTEPKDDTKDEPKDEPAPSTPQTTPTAPAQTTPKAEVTPKAQTTPKPEVAPKTQTKPKAQTEPKKKTSPAMGDNTNSVLVVTMLGLGVVICTVGIKRRKRA